MKNQSTGSTPISESRNQSWFDPYCIALAIMWVAISGVIIVMLMHDVRHTDQFSVLSYVLQGAYVSTLLWYIGCTSHSKNHLPEIRFKVTRVFISIE